MKREITLPGWLYAVFWFLALAGGAAKLTLVGKIPWLLHGGQGEAWLEFVSLALTNAGFASKKKDDQ